jgi:tetratricopeptide (TPR) repeat protein
MKWVLGFVATAAWAQGQHQHAAPAEKPVALLNGMGAYSRPISGAAPEAQRFFNQGLNLLYGFNRYEALRSFQKAAELSPRAAMPLWGIAMAQSPHVNMDLDGDANLKEACAALERTKGLSAPVHEQVLVDAAFRRCPEDSPEYVDAMKAAAAAYPDDPDIATLYAEALMIRVRWKWWSGGKPAEGVEEAIATLEGVLRRLPNHPGANHLYIHAVEASPAPERAIPSAQRLMGLVPSAGHLVHMPGHIWLLTGDYELAAVVNERAARVDEEYMAKTGVTASAYAGYYVHNLHFVAYARQMQGRKADAIKAADAVTKAAAPYAAQMPSMVDAFLPVKLFALVRFGDWDAILAEPKPDGKVLATTAIWHWARAQAMAMRNRRAASAREQGLFEDARQRVPADWAWLNNMARDVLAVAADVLEARLAASVQGALPHWRRAVARQDALVYDEPPPWFYPVRESLGAALLVSGQPVEAEAVFRDGLRQTPRNGRMLFGLLEALQAQKKAAAADQVRRELQDAWKRADVTLRLGDL